MLKSQEKYKDFYGNIFKNEKVKAKTFSINKIIFIYKRNYEISLKKSLCKQVQI